MESHFCPLLSPLWEGRGVIRRHSPVLRRPCTTHMTQTIIFSTHPPSASIKLLLVVKSCGEPVRECSLSWGDSDPNLGVLLRFEMLWSACGERLPVDPSPAAPPPLLPGEWTPYLSNPWSNWLNLRRLGGTCGPLRSSGSLILADEWGEEPLPPDETTQTVWMVLLYKLPDWGTNTTCRL